MIAEESRHICIATPTPTGFLAQEPLRVGLVLRGAGDMDAPLGDAVVREAGVVDAPDAVRDGARYLEERSADGHTLVVVHRTEDIAKNLGGDTRKALRQALGALEEDPTQLEALLKLTEKVIFDSDDVVRTTPLRPTNGAKRGPGGRPRTGIARAFGCREEVLDPPREEPRER